MRTCAALLLAVCFLSSARASAQHRAVAPLKWTPATFRGLTMGITKRADVIRALGRPDADLADSTGRELLYNGRGDHHGDLRVFINRAGRIIEIEEQFRVAIPRSKIYKELGSDALTSRFVVDGCNFYRDLHGSLELTFYPARGIYLWPDQYGYDFAAIHYSAQPPGETRMPNCLF